MRFIAAIGFVVPLLVLVWVLTRGPWPEPAAQAAAREVADSLTRVRCAALDRGDLVVWGAALRPDVLLLEEDADPARSGAEAALAGRRADPATGPGFALGTPEELVAGATRRGRFAWTAVRSGGRRLTTAWLRRDGAWGVLIEHHARAPTWAELRTGAGTQRSPAPAPLAATEGRSAARLEKRFRRALAHYGRLRTDSQAIAVGPAEDGMAVGDSAVEAMVADWERRLGAPRIVPDGVRVWAPRRGGVGWVVAYLEVIPPGWGGITLPLRFTGVYRQRGGEHWSLVLAHLSAVPGGEGGHAGAVTP